MYRCDGDVYMCTTRTFSARSVNTRALRKLPCIVELIVDSMLIFFSPIFTNSISMHWHGAFRTPLVCVSYLLNRFPFIILNFNLYRTIEGICVSIQAPFLICMMLTLRTIKYNLISLYSCNVSERAHTSVYCLL